MTTDRLQEMAEVPLQGWRRIADYFGRDVRTVRRWAADSQLPVHRAGRDGGRGVPVYAFASELEGWLRSDKGRSAAEAGPAAPSAPETAPAPEPARARRLPRRGLLAGGAGLLALTAAGVGLDGTRRRDLAASSLAPGPARAVPEAARDLYLRGTYLWNQRTPQGIEGAIAALTRALQIHPDYAEAHAGLAMTYNLARQYSGMSGYDAYPLAETHARRAVALAPGHAFGHSVLAFVEFHWLWQVRAGLARFERARRLDPADANNLLWYASSLIHVLRWQDALATLDAALLLDPSSATLRNFRGLTLHALGERARGIAVLEELIHADPAHAWHYHSLAQCRLAERDYAGYLANYALVGDRIAVPRYRALAEAGLAALRRGGARAMAAAMAAIDRAHFEAGTALAWDLAMDHAMVGDWRQAMPLLHISLERHEERLIGVKYNTAFWPIRDRPEYRRLLARIGLPAT